MGIKNGPAMFQRMIILVMRDALQAMTYVNVVLIGSDGSKGDLLQQHFEDCCQVLTAFRRHQITAKGVKVHLFMTMVKFCGHVLLDGQRRAAPSKLEAVAKWTPGMIKTVTNLKGFLGLCQYYSQYVKGFAEIARLSVFNFEGDPLPTRRLSGMLTCTSPSRS